MLEKLALAERRIIAGNAERNVGTNDEQLSFEGAFKELKALEKELAVAAGVVGDLSPPPAPPAPPPDNAPTKKPDGRKTPSTPPTGRRDLSKSSLPLEEYEVLDPELEGKAERIGFEDLYRLGHRRGGKVRVCIRLAVYKKLVEGTPVPVAVIEACSFGATACAG